MIKFLNLFNDFYRSINPKKTFFHCPQFLNTDDPLKWDYTFVNYWNEDSFPLDLVETKVQFISNNIKAELDWLSLHDRLPLKDKKAEILGERYRMTAKILKQVEIEKEKLSCKKSAA